MRVATQPQMHAVTRVLAEAGVTQRDVANVLGVSRSYVSHMIRGQNRVHRRFLEAVEELAGPGVAGHVAHILWQTHAETTKHERSRAVHALRLSGVGIRQLGERVGVSSSSVSRMLAGRQRPHPDLLDALRELVGPEQAGEVWALMHPVRLPPVPSRRGLPPGWSSGHGLAACQGCGRPTTVRDELGDGRHVGCR